MKRTFLPWVGSDYTTGGRLGIRVLILGEAHYGLPEEAVPDFTQRIVRKLGQQERFRFYTFVQNLVENREGGRADEERRTFWEGVAFYNYIQEFPGTFSRIRPTERMWDEAAEPYLDTLKELKPDLVIILGDDLWEHVPYDDCRTPLCGIAHPSSYRYDTQKAKNQIIASIREVKDKPNKALHPTPRGVDEL